MRKDANEHATGREEKKETTISERAPRQNRRPGGGQVDSGLDEHARLAGVFYDRTVDPAFCVGEPRIYVFWHEYILLPLALRGHCHLSMLLSQHADADILARIAHHLGFDCVRGSSRRGGARAIMELEEHSRNKHLTITPDGPRGPRRRLAMGPVYLASRLQLPLVVMGFGYDRPWRVNSWDQFAVPRPFSRARAVDWAADDGAGGFGSRRFGDVPRAGRAADELPDERSRGVGRRWHAEDW